MVHQKPTHRHLIALPLAAVLLAVIGLTNTAVPMSASLLSHARRDLVVSAAETAKEMDLPSGLHISLEPGAEAHLGSDGEEITVTRGVVLADAQGLATFSLPCLTVSLLHSAAYASVSDGSVTVAAVDGPVLLRSCDDRLLLLAEGEQAYVSLDTVDVSTVPAVWLSAVQSRIASRPPSASAVQNVFSVPFSKDATPTDVASAFVAADVQGEGVSTLLAFRLLPILPRFDDMTKEKVFTTLFSSDALRTQVARALPYAASADTLTLNDAVMTAWTNAAAVLATSDAGRLLSVLDYVAGLPSFFDTAGYPKQSRLWMQALRDTVSTLHPLLSVSDRSSLDALLTRALNHVAAEQPVVPQKDEHPTMNLSDAELSALTEDMLSRFEVLRTAITKVTPDHASQTARVEGIYLPENGQDVPYDFTYALGNGIISGVVRDGIKLPNKIHADAFFSFLRKEAP